VLNAKVGELVSTENPTAGPGDWPRMVVTFRVVATENSVRSENKEVPIICEIMVATTMSSLFVALFA